MKIKTKEICLYGLLGALMFALKFAMSSLPNIEPVSLLLISFTVVFGVKAIYPLSVYIILEMLIYGFGSDGMVSTSKDILKIVGDNTPNYVQGYFQYDSKKSGGVTRSHLRIGSRPILSTYYVDNPDWLAEKEFLEKRGAELVFFPYTEQTSSTKIKALINKQLEK